MKAGMNTTYRSDISLLLMVALLASLVLAVGPAMAQKPV